MKTKTKIILCTILAVVFAAVGAVNLAYASAANTSLTLAIFAPSTFAALALLYYRQLRKEQATRAIP